MGSTCVDDCYFYYYSSCTKGSDCPFRHCEAALGTETVCTLWREGLCYRNNCKFRHMESRINRSSIPCYWENQPGGCRKPHCVFFHHKDRTNLNVFTKTEGLILPISSQPVSPGKTIDSSADTKMESSESQSLSPPHSIQPVVVSLGEAEESDTESTTTTPIKIISSLGKKTPSPMKCASVPTANVASYEEDLGIKTLEQIRMEKIHRESEHFYNPGDCFLSAGKTGVIDADASEECAGFETMHTESNGYYPQEYSTTEEELTSNNLEMESYQDDGLYPMEMNSVAQSCSDSPKSAPGDLRQILKKKRHVPEKERFPKKLPTKRIISLKKSGTSEELSDVVCVVKTQPRNQEDDIGFRVKTLDEIRREKEKKQQGVMSPPPSLEEEMQDEEDDVDNPITNLSHQFKEPSVENKTKPDGDKPIISISRQVKIRSVENKTKPDGDKPIINISRQVKIQPVENKTKPGGDKPIINIKIQSAKSKMKPEGSKRKLCRKPLELYKPVHRIRKDMEENARMLERYSTQVGDDSVSDDENPTKNSTQEIIPCKEENQSNNSLKRACDSDVPVAPKIKRTVTLQMDSLQKLSEPRVEEEKPSRLVVPDQKNDNSLTFKRRNIIRRKNLNNVPSSQSSVTDEDSNSQFQNSDSQTELSVQTSKLSVLSSQNGTHMDSSDFHEKTDVEMSDEKGKASNIASPPPSVPIECENEKGSLISSTFDEYDTLFLSTESDICSNETGGSTVPKAEDLFLEFEKIIQS